MIDSRTKINNLLHPNIQHYNNSGMIEKPDWLDVQYVEPKHLNVMTIQPAELIDIKVIGYKNTTLMEYYEKVRSEDEHDIIDDLLNQIKYCNTRIIRMDNGMVYGSNENIRHIMSAMDVNDPVYCVWDFKYTTDEIDFIKTYSRHLMPEDMHFIEHSTK